MGRLEDGNGGRTGERVGCRIVPGEGLGLRVGSLAGDTLLLPLFAGGVGRGGVADEVGLTGALNTLVVGLCTGL